MSATGQKKGIFGLRRAKAGQRIAPGKRPRLSAAIFPKSSRWVPAEPIDAMSLRLKETVARDSVIARHGSDASGTVDHDFVIGASGRNKL